MASRQELANLWHRAAQIARTDVFGSEDKLRPTYLPLNGVLAAQIDVPAVGMVGPRYRGDIALLSVNGAGGKSNHAALPSSDAMYSALEELGCSAPGKPALTAFEELNGRTIASIPDWSIWKRHIQHILAAAEKQLDEIAFLYVVPFRTKDDFCTKMDQSRAGREYLDAGYHLHLAPQLQALAPSLIVPMDKPSNKAAIRFKGEAPHTDVIYYTGQLDGHAERANSLARIASRFA